MKALIARTTHDCSWLSQKAGEPAEKEVTEMRRLGVLKQAGSLAVAFVLLLGVSLAQAADQVEITYDLSESTLNWETISGSLTSVANDDDLTSGRISGSMKVRYTSDNASGMPIRDGTATLLALNLTATKLELPAEPYTGRLGFWLTGTLRWQLTAPVVAKFTAGNVLTGLASTALDGQFLMTGSVNCLPGLTYSVRWFYCPYFFGLPPYKTRVTYRHSDAVAVSGEKGQYGGAQSTRHTLSGRVPGIAWQPNPYLGLGADFYPSDYGGVFIVGREVLREAEGHEPKVAGSEADADGDGVLDGADNCPAVGNADQANQDGDMLGDACDACPSDPDNDVDGDGLCATEDVCPADPGNPDLDEDGVCDNVDICPLGDDNLDADGDGTPDACDACPVDADNDVDGDGVCGDVDNCPLVANDNQEDTDGDLLGDACDSDIDGDAVLNEEDNCRFDVNPDQVDADMDGAGDVCDEDVDGDGVLDSIDACVSSPLGAVVNAHGCAIRELCPCAHSGGVDRWKNHGAYVRCVAHASEDFLTAGLITEAEKDATVSQAGESACGHKK